uniref:Uncharacterized protein n=1 Tax=Arundo donax TaxID=35708 RepID=A0A0A9DBF5_ARUDO
MNHVLLICSITESSSVHVQIYRSVTIEKIAEESVLMHSSNTECQSASIECSDST